MVGFDFTLHIRRVCADMVARLECLRHIDLDRVAIRFCQTRQQGPHGVQASLTPLRFEGGSRTTRKRGRLYTVQTLHDIDGREMLYLLSFYLPRFLDRPLHYKLSTIIHELWHIGPEFDGDLRRHEGRCYAHSGSQKQYDALMDQFTAEWLSLNPPEDLYAFLRCSFGELTRQFGGVYGRKIATPRLVPLSSMSPVSG